MKSGQTLRITSTGGKGRITEVSKADDRVDIIWQLRISKGDCPQSTRYTFHHIKSLLNDGILSIYDELSVEDPNVLFNKFKREV